MIDVNVSLFQWPFRRLPHDEPQRLVEALHTAGITQAWAGSFEGLLHKDIAAVNDRLAAECAQHEGLLVPFGAVNPTLPDWPEDVRRCAEDHHMPGIRLHPNYHNYRVDAPLFAEVLEQAQAHKLIVQIALRMEDPRTQHPLVQVEDVDVTPLPDVAKQFPDVPLILTNSLRTVTGTALDPLATVPNLFVDIAMLEGVGGIERLIERFPFERVLFGSHFPFFYLQSALLKLQESNLGQHIREAITHQNAHALLSQSTPRRRG